MRASSPVSIHRSQSWDEPSWDETQRRRSPDGDQRGEAFARVPLVKGR